MLVRAASDPSVRWDDGEARGVHSSPSDSGAKILSISASLTPSGVAGSHLGSPVLSTITARTPSAKSGRSSTRLAMRYSCFMFSAKSVSSAASAS